MTIEGRSWRHVPITAPARRAGRTAGKAIDPALPKDITVPPESRSTDWPTIGSFTVRPPGIQSQVMQDFYARRDELERKARAYRFDQQYPGRAPGAEMDSDEMGELYRLSESPN